MGRGATSADLAASNLFYDAPHRRREPDSIRAQYLALQELDLTDLDLRTYFEGSFYGPTATGKNNKTYSGTKAWGAQVPSLPEDWGQRLSFTPHLHIEARRAATVALNNYFDARSRSIFQAILEVNPNPAATEASTEVFDEHGNARPIHFGFFKSEALKAVEALVGERGVNANWFCCAVNNAGSASALSKHLLYLDAREPKEIQGAELLGWAYRRQKFEQPVN